MTDENEKAPARGFLVWRGDEIGYVRADIHETRVRELAQKLATTERERDEALKTPVNAEAKLDAANARALTLESSLRDLLAWERDMERASVGWDQGGNDGYGLRLAYKEARRVISTKPIEVSHPGAEWCAKERDELRALAKVLFVDGPWPDNVRAEAKRLGVI